MHNKRILLEVWKPVTKYHLHNYGCISNSFHLLSISHIPNFYQTIFCINLICHLLFGKISFHKFALKRSNFWNATHWGSLMAGVLTATVKAHTLPSFCCKISYFKSKLYQKGRYNMVKLHKVTLLWSPV